jgi:hypothetical protein
MRGAKVARVWQIVTINETSNNRYRVTKPKTAITSENEFICIEEIVEDRLNTFSAEGWEVYECKITSSQFARIIFYKEDRPPCL